MFSKTLEKYLVPWVSCYISDCLFTMFPSPEFMKSWY